MVGVTLTAIAFTPVFILIAVLGILARRWRIFSEPLDNTEEWLNKIGSKLFNPVRSRANEFIAKRVSEKVLADSQYRDAVLSKLESRLGLRLFLRTAQSYSLYSRDRLRTWSRQDQERTVDEVRGVLAQELKAGYLTSAIVLVKSVVDIESHAIDVLDELQLVPERIVGDKPATYERWDRLSSEAEFRQAVVPPLVAIICVMLSRGLFDLPYGLLVFTAPLVILIQGIQKELAGQAQLMQAEAGVVQVDSLQNLAVNDLRWMGLA
jgi:ferredoxin-fold anticodon binding domain-containing protein